jgi:hypothetical protein
MSKIKNVEKPFSEWETKDLIDYAKELHCSIYNVECFGVNDLIWYEGILKELEKRGYEISENSNLVIEEREEE